MDSEPILWQGKVTKKLKRRLFLIVAIANLAVLPLLILLYGLAEFNWVIVQIASYVLIVPILAIDIGMLLQYHFDAYARYYLTPTTLIKKRWPYSWRRMMNTFGVHEVNTIYIKEISYFEKNNVYFFREPLETILQKYPLGENVADSFQNFDFWFDNVEDPLKFIAALQGFSLLKPIPSWRMFIPE